MNQITPIFDQIDTQLLLVRSSAGSPDGPLALTSDPVGPLDAVTLQYLNNALQGLALHPSVTGQPRNATPGQFWWNPADQNLQIYVDDQWKPTTAPIPQADPIDYLPLAGGSLNGTLYLSDGYPAASTNFVTSMYSGQFLSLTGGELTGFLTLFSDPILPLHAATKQYVDQFKYLSLIDEAPPMNPRDGMLWWDTKSAQLFVWNAGQWVMANTPTFGCDQPSPPPGAGNSFFGPFPPDSPRPGDIWITETGQISIWNGTTWVSASGPPGPMGPQGNPGTSVTIMGKFDHLHQLLAAHPYGQAGEGYMVGQDLYVWSPTSHSWVNVGRIQGPPGTLVTIAVSPPNTPKDSDLWWDSLQGNLYIWYEDEDSHQWVITNRG